MREVFNLKRTGVYWWGLITALIFLIPGAWLKGTASFIRTVDWLQPNKPPFVWFDNLGTWIDSVAEGVFKTVQFNPKAMFGTIGPYGIANLGIALVMGLLLIVFSFLLYRRAAATPGIWDDLVAMMVIYLVLRIEGVAAESLQIPLIDFLRTQAPQSYLVILGFYMVFMMIAGRGSQDSAVFFKVLFEAVIVWLFVVPQATAQALATIIEFPTSVHTFLVSDPSVQPYFPIVEVIWAALGILMIGSSLYSAGRIVRAEKGPIGGLEELVPPKKEKSRKKAEA